MNKLSEHLIKQQKLTATDIKEIHTLHAVREHMFSEMELLNPSFSRDKEILRLYAALLIPLEFELQHAWKFKRDATKHTWWNKVPHCTCPYLDNNDPVYTLRHLNSNCPVHGH